MIKRGWIVFLLVVSVGLVYGASALVGDFDEDCDVDFSDFVIFSGAFGNFYEGKEWDRRCDLDSNGEMDIEDFLKFAENFDKKCVERPRVAKPSDCGAILDVNERDYCWDLEALRNLDKEICNNIQDSQLREFCEYRVDVFAGSYSKVLRGYHVRIERDSDMNLNSLLANYETKEFSGEEYGAIGERDWRVVYSDNRRFDLLFVIEAPEDQKFGNVDFGDRSNFRVFESSEFIDFEENIWVRVSSREGEYISLGEHRGNRADRDSFSRDAIPVIDGRISFIIHDYHKKFVVDRGFAGVQFAENEGDFGYAGRIWGRSELKPNGEFERL